MPSSREKVFETQVAPRVRDTDDLEDFGFKRHDTVILHHTDQVLRWSRMISIITNLPNDSFWTSLMVVSSVINFVVGTTCFFFARSHLMNFIPIYILCDLVYLANVVVLSLHRYWKFLKMKSYTVRVSTPIYLLDVISVLPQELIAVAIFGSTSMISISLRWITYVRLRYLIKLSQSLSQVLNNRRRTFNIAFFSAMFVVQHLLTCIIYETSCHHLRCINQPLDENSGPVINTYSNPNISWKPIIGTRKMYRNATLGDITRQTIHWSHGKWSETIIKSHPYYKDAGAFDWYILCSYAILELLITVGSGNIEPISGIERLEMSLIMLLGYILFGICFLTFLFHMLTVMGRNKVDYLFKVQSIKFFLSGALITKELMRNIDEYFNILWIKKDGIKTAPHFETLPPPLRMEIMYDINCAHLHRSLLFHDLKEFYLRTLALFMKHEFLLPGDILFHQGVVKTFLVVVIKGILEILSDEDDESPVIAFQAGTVLGEACLFLSLPSKATVRAAVYTEVKLIERVDFIRTISSYPVAFFYLRDRITKRIEATRTKIESQKEDSANLDIYGENALVPIKAFKDLLLEKQKRVVSVQPELQKSSGMITGKSKYFSNILGLYQISYENSNVEVPVVCLTYNFPWILDSTSSLVRFWEFIVIAVHLVFLIAYAYQVVFLRQIMLIVHGLRFFSDVVCLIDVTLIIMTSVVLKDKVLKTFKEIVRYRMKSVDFYLNAIPVFPYEYFMLAVDTLDTEHYNRIYDLLMGVKILRLRRCYTLMKKIEAFYSGNSWLFSIFYTTIYFWGITYFAGCILYLSSCLYEVCNEESWFYKLMVKAVKSNEGDPCYLYPFATSLYFAVNIWMHLGLGDIRPALPNDLYGFVIYSMTGLLAGTYLMASIAATLSLMTANSELFQEEIISFQRFLEHYKVPVELLQEVKRFFALRWSFDRAIGRIQFKKMAPKHIQMEVFKANLMKVMISVPLFQIIDVDFLMEMILSANVTILPEGATVCYAGDVDREMFIIQKGCCAVYDFRGVFLRNLKAGDHFGALEMLFNMSKCDTVRTTTSCRLVQITFRGLMSAMSMFPGELVIVNRVLHNEEFVKLAEAIELKKMISFLHEVKVKTVKKRKRVLILKKYQTYFTLAGNCFVKIGGKEKYWAPFRQMGKWQILGFLLMPITIHPEAPILKLWLMVRMLGLVAMGVCVPVALGLPPAGNLAYFIIGFIEYTAYIELYLFLHIAYYNEDGLLITHPKLTARYYFTHGFFMDLVAALPYYEILPWLSYDNDNLDDSIAHLVNKKFCCMWRTLSLLQYHRFIGFIKYLQSDILAKKSMLSFLIILPLLFLAFLIATTILIRECRFNFFTKELAYFEDRSSIILHEPDGSITYHGYLMCRRTSWLAYIKHHEASTPILAITLAFHWFLNVFSHVGLGDITPNNDFGMYCTILMAFVGLGVFAYILAFLSGQTRRSSVLALDYQKKVQELLRMLYKEGVAELKIHKIFRYFEYVWKRTEGMEKKEMLMDLNSALKGDIALFIYEKTLREVLIFRRIARPYLRVIAKNLREEYFLRNDVLIKCYDVHNTVYIILRGSVNVQTPYDDSIASIGSGGIFGNLHQAAPGCSSATFIAERNVDALKMSSEMFYLIAQEYPAVREVLEKGLKNVGDYIMPPKKTRRISEDNLQDMDDDAYDEVEIMSRSYLPDVENQHIQKALPTSTTDHVQRIIIPKNKCLVCLLFLKPKYWFKFALEPDHIVFQYVWYTTFLATCYQMFMIPYMFASQNFNMYIFISTLCCEPVYYIRLFFFMHEAYLDNYGTYVRKFKLIAWHYFKDYKRVCWDVIPNLPFYLMYPFAERKNQLFIFSCLRLFHLLRWRYIFQAFAVWSEPLMAKRAPILIVKMLVVFLMMVHYFALMAFLVFGNFGDFSQSPRKSLQHSSPWDSYSICVYYISSIISTTGVGDIIPMNTVELYMTIAVTISTKTTYAALIVCFLLGIRILSQHIINYESKVMRMKKFLQNQGLSDHLMEKLWMYIKQIWNREYGLHMPELLVKAPYVMKCEIMREIYSVHLRKGYLFEGINEALLTQICGHLRRVVFFRGNYIVQNGDTNASMYWIHRGQVSVLTVHPNLTETRHEILNVHGMFGMSQGLTYGIPHKYSYRAETQCDILVLKLEDWEYVLQHFPKDKEVIYRRMMNTYTKF